MLLYFLQCCFVSHGLKMTMPMRRRRNTPTRRRRKIVMPTTKRGLDKRYEERTCIQYHWSTKVW